jgi:uncharacterized protein (DUF1330 family)
MAAYAIANYRITNPEQIQAYRAQAIPQLIQAGCEFLVVTDAADASEGSPAPTVIVLKFPSMEAAKNWYNSPEYQAIMPLRTAASEDAWVVFAEEFVMPSA